MEVPVMGALNERAISIEEVREAVNGMKYGKCPGLDGFIIIIIIITIIIKTSSACPSRKNNVYELPLQPHKHLHHGKRKKTQLGEATNG